MGPVGCLNDRSRYGIPCPGARCYTNSAAPAGSVLPGRTVEAFSGGVSTCKRVWEIGDRYRPSAYKTPSVRLEWL